MEREPVWRLRSLAPEQTEALGERLGAGLVAGALVALNGELGAGKTTLVRGLARGLGVTEPVVSPTFARMRALPGRLALYHFDAWRGGGEALFEEGTEFLSGDGVAVVEWAERIQELLPRPRIELFLTHRTPEERLLQAYLVAPEEGSSAAREGLARALEKALGGASGTPGLEILGSP